MLPLASKDGSSSCAQAKPRRLLSCPSHGVRVLPEPDKHGNSRRETPAAELLPSGRYVVRIIVDVGLQNADPDDCPRPARSRRRRANRRRRDGRGHPAGYLRTAHRRRGRLGRGRNSRARRGRRPGARRRRASHGDDRSCIRRAAAPSDRDRGPPDRAATLSARASLCAGTCPRMAPGSDQRPDRRLTRLGSRWRAEVARGLRPRAGRGPDRGLDSLVDARRRAPGDDRWHRRATVSIGDRPPVRRRPSRAGRYRRRTGRAVARARAIEHGRLARTTGGAAALGRAGAPTARPLPRARSTRTWRTSPRALARSCGSAAWWSSSSRTGCSSTTERRSGGSCWRGRQRSTCR